MQQIHEEINPDRDIEDNTNKKALQQQQKNSRHNSSRNKRRWMW